MNSGVSKEVAKEMTVLWYSFIGIPSDLPILSLIMGAGLAIIIN